MVPRVPDLALHLGQQGMSLVRGPAERTGEDGDGQRLDDSHPVAGHHGANLLQALAWIARIGRGGILCLDYLLESRLSQERLILGYVVDRATEGVEALVQQPVPPVECAALKGVVRRPQVDDPFCELDPAAGVEIVVYRLKELSLAWYIAEHANVDEVEFGIQGPRLGCVHDKEAAVGRAIRRPHGFDVDPEDRGGWILLG